MASSFITSWASAIASFEGFNTAGSVAARDNNPGNLKYAGQAGATGQDSQGFAIFPDATTGWSALYNQLQVYVNNFPGYSLLQIMAHYLDYVSSSLGVDSGTTLAELASNSALPADGSGSSTSDSSSDGTQILGIDPMWLAAGAVGIGVVLFWVLSD
jgi:hypothetical protein